MNVIRRDLIESIHRSSAQLSACICGAGTSAISSLTKVSDCSRTLIYAETIYSFSAIDRTLGCIPKSVVSKKVARQLAQRAFHHSQDLIRMDADASPGSVFLMGVGATSAIQTSLARRGKDRAHMCIWSSRVNFGLGEQTAATGQAEVLDQVDSRVCIHDFYAEPPLGWDRYQQDDCIELFILYNIGKVIQKECASTAELDSVLRMIASTSFLAELGPAVSSPFLLSAAPVSKCSVSAVDPVAEAIQFVLNGETSHVIFNEFGEIRCDVEPYALEEISELNVPLSSSTNLRNLCLQEKAVRLVYPGSFRPLHYGHTELAQAALRVLTGRRLERRGTDARTRVTYEIAVSILDKGNVSCEDLIARVRQFFQRGDRVAITNAPRFTEKARLFPGHGFVVGVDTAKRILDPQYYEGGDVVQALLRDIGERGCYFVVGGRTVAKKHSSDAKDFLVWEDLHSLEIPEPLRHLFIGLREGEFHIDISSTELRARLGIK